MADAPGRAAMVRRVIGSSLSLGLIVSAVAFYQLAPALPRTPAPIPQVGATTATRTPEAGPGSRTPATSPSPDEPTPTPAPTPTRSAHDPNELPAGPGVSEPGILMLATPDSDGSFDVSEMVRYPAPVSTVTLRPPTIRRVGGMFAGSRARAEQVQLGAGDQPVVVPRGRVRRPVDLTVSTTKEIELRYRLTGVTQRTMPSSAGRALATIGPLIGSVPADFPVMIVVTGSAVRNLTCPQLPLSEQSCADARAPRVWFVGSLPAADALVQVQLDLPRPR